MRVAMSLARGLVRDSIIEFLQLLDREASIGEINRAVALRLGRINESSVRSYLNNNVPDLFERTGRGRYRLRTTLPTNVHHVSLGPAVTHGRATLYHADCFDWLADYSENSIHAVVTDPPYGVV